jgi:transposase
MPHLAVLTALQPGRHRRRAGAGLTSRPGIGPVSAAQAFVSFSHPGRCRNEAAFAKLTGTSPIEASSGQMTRHRLNRAGDRALNRAIHIIAGTRMRCDPTTAYVVRRRAPGKTDHEIRRCIKRYIARQLYRTRSRADPPSQPTRSGNLADLVDHGDAQQREVSPAVLASVVSSR